MGTSFFQNILWISATVAVVSSAGFQKHVLSKVEVEYPEPAETLEKLSDYPAPFKSTVIDVEYQEPIPIPSTFSSTSRNSSCTSLKSVHHETRTIPELYSAALKEGGRLIVYSGGAQPNEQRASLELFESTFPGLKVQMISDTSRHHAARINNQIARGYLIPDVIQSEQLQNFAGWKCQGVFHPYKPVGWEHVYPEFKDAQGYYTGTRVLAFSNYISRAQLGELEEFWPTEPEDYLDPRYKGRIVSAHPANSDIALFMYKLFVDRYGWSWLAKFVSQVVFVRTPQISRALVNNATFAATFTTTGEMRQPGTETQFVLPKQGLFAAHVEMNAILAGARNLAAAKLYMSWWLEKGTQEDFWFQWSVRKDVSPPGGSRGVFDYPGQMDVSAYQRFLEDPAAMDRFRDEVTLYTGEVSGDDTTLFMQLGLDPNKMLPQAFQ